MPLYAYKCQACGHEFDKFQHFIDDPLKVCPVCCEESLRKVYSPVGIVFKGKGFYATDNRSPSGMTSSKTSPENTSSPEPTTASTSATSTDSNSATKNASGAT